MYINTILTNKHIKDDSNHKGDGEGVIGQHSEARRRSYSYECYTIWQMIGLNQFGYYQSVLVLMKYILRFDSEPRLTNPRPTGRVILLRVD